MDLLADLTLTSREELAGNDGAIGRALGRDQRDIGSTISDALSGDSERKEQAELRMGLWADRLRAHGIAAPEVKTRHRDDPDQPGDLSPPSDADDTGDCRDQGSAPDA